MKTSFSFPEDKRVPIADEEANKRFREAAVRLSRHPEGFWTARYVDWEWFHIRYLLEDSALGVKDRMALEIGCNVGATAIVLALLGAKVTAVDVSERYLELARINAERYGVSERVTFIHIPDTRCLPFPDTAFDLVCCN